MRVLFCPCVVQKVTAHVYGKTLNISHQSQKGFRGILFGITQQQKGYLTYVPSTQKIVSSHEIVFDEFISSAWEYTSCSYSEELATQPAVLYIPYATYSHEQTGKIITFSQFEEGDLFENESNLVEYKSISAWIDKSYAYDNSDIKSINKDAIKEIQDGNYVHPNINAIYSRLKIYDRIRQA